MPPRPSLLRSGGSPSPRLRQGFSPNHARTPTSRVRMRESHRRHLAWLVDLTACVCPPLPHPRPPILPTRESQRHLRNVAPLNTHKARRTARRINLHLQPVPRPHPATSLPSCAPAHDSCRDSTARPPSSDCAEMRRNLLRGSPITAEGLSRPPQPAIVLTFPRHPPALPATQHQECAVPSFPSIARHRRVPFDTNHASHCDARSSSSAAGRAITSSAPIHHHASPGSPPIARATGANT